MTEYVPLHLAGAVAILIFAGFLMVCPKYKDGIVGRLGLGAMCFVCGMILIRAYEGYPFIPSASEIGMMIGVVIFLGWHCFRFARRIMTEKTTHRRATDSPKEAL